MSGLIPRNVEQMRRQAIKDAQEKKDAEVNYQNTVDNLSKHNVGGLYDIRSIKKSTQFKEQKNFYDVRVAEEELENLLQSHQIFTMKDEIMSYIKKITAGTDSFNVRETGKIISSILNKFREKHEIKN
jgi:alpha-tubulin suppressor-like RCC1 family protein